MFTEFDVIISVIVLATMVMTYRAGFLDSILGLASVILSGYVAVSIFDDMVAKVSEWFDKPLLISIVAVIIVFFIAYILLNLLHRVLAGGLGIFVGGAFDRLMGFLLGAFFAYIVVGAIYLLIINVQGKEPKWLLETQTYGLTGSASNFVNDNIGGFLKGKLDEYEAKNLDAEVITEPNNNIIIKDSLEQPTNPNFYDASPFDGQQEGYQEAPSNNSNIF